ncbi:hypothetical protein D3C71_1457230 [compost metagenome]
MFQEQFAVAVGRRRTVPQVGQEALDIVVQEKQGGGRARRIGAALRGRGQRGAVAVAPRAAHQDEQPFFVVI